MKCANIYEKLLKNFSDGIISMQDKSNDIAFKGGVKCPVCKNIHGRCPDAVYGLVVMAKRSGNMKYLKAAKDVFLYGENMLCTDGGLYNDAQTTWRYTTTFHETNVIEALRAGRDILDEETKKAFADRVKRMAKWLYENLDETSPANINYATTNALALALAGNELNERKYLEKAKKLAYYAMAHITENGLLYGESKPHDKLSEKGCRGIDLGYNMEESVPALVKYAFETGDEELKERLTEIVRAHLKFVLPDGGIDNTMGNRNNKWTYWGSRTSDGVTPMFLLLADRDERFSEAAYRNAKMLDKCTKNGILYGGPHYFKRGEYPCTHHVVEHINSIAFALENIDGKYLVKSGAKIPSDEKNFFDFYPEMLTYRAAKGDYLMTVTDYDFDIFFSGHATGGTLTALYNRKKGPMVMGSVTDYVLVEPTNMQQVKDRDKHRSLVPRFVVEKDGVTYNSSMYLHAETSAKNTKKACVITAKTGLNSKSGELSGVCPTVRYSLTGKGLNISAEEVGTAKFVLPLIAGDLTVNKGKTERAEEIFFLTGGFIATEYVVLPDKDGKIDLTVV